MAADSQGRRRHAFRATWPRPSARAAAHRLAQREVRSRTRSGDSVTACRFLQLERRTFGVYAEIGLEPRDCWIGVFWRFHRFKGKISGSDWRWGSFSGRPWVLDVYVCLVPCIVLRVNLDRVVRP